MIKKFASLFSAGAANYGKIIKDLENENFNGIHFDIMDGNFNINISVDGSINKET